MSHLTSRFSNFTTLSIFFPFGKRMKFSKQHCFKSFKLYCSLRRAHKPSSLSPVSLYGLCQQIKSKLLLKNDQKLLKSCQKIGTVSPLLKCKMGICQATATFSSRRVSLPELLHVICSWYS